MTEAEWLTTDDSRAMFGLVSSKASYRKSRLSACGFCRLMRPLFTENELRLVLTAERYADGEIDARQLEAALFQNFGHADKGRRADDPLVKFVWDCLQSDGTDPRFGWLYIESVPKYQRCRALLLRDVFGNPFRTIAFSPSWRTDTAVTLASQMYESRDFSAMPILADALQDAGCDSTDVLDHCRGPGPHVRGCWIVDLVLGKS